MTRNVKDGTPSEWVDHGNYIFHHEDTALYCCSLANDLADEFANKEHGKDEYRVMDLDNKVVIG